MADLNFIVEGESLTATRFDATARQFSILVDEPPALGGEDLGANPVEYLLAAYAGCINVVAHLTARELGIHVIKLSISVSGDLNPGRFLGLSDEERAGFKHIEVKFLPITDATPELLQKWVETIKRRCPINDNLASPTPLSFNVVSVNELSVN